MRLVTAIAIVLLSGCSSNGNMAYFQSSIPGVAETAAGLYGYDVTCYGESYQASLDVVSETVVINRFPNQTIRVRKDCKIIKKTIK